MYFMIEQNMAHEQGYACDSFHDWHSVVKLMNLQENNFLCLFVFFFSKHEPVQ